MKITRIGNPADSVDLSNPEEIHLVWIGTYLTENSLMIIESIDQCKNLNVKVNFWVDTDFFPKMKTQSMYPWLRIRDIKSLNYFYLIREHIYPLFMKEKVYNYLKEIFSLMVLTEYGGYYFDTTTKLTVKSDTVVSLPSYTKFVAPYYKKYCNDIGFDVYFYYSPKNYSLTKEMLFFMVNMFHLKFFYRKNADSELHKISFKNFIDQFPELFNCKVRDDLTILSVIKREAKNIWEAVLISHLYVYVPCIDPSESRIDLLYTNIIEDEYEEKRGYHISNTIEAEKFFGKTEWEYNPSWIIRFDSN